MQWERVMTTDLLLEHLDGVKRVNGGYEAKCPAHDDEHLSLSIREGRDDQILVHCFTGCAAEDIMRAAGQKIGAFEHTNGHTAQTPVERCADVEISAATPPTPESESGAEVFEKVRGFVRRFVHLGDHEAAAVTLWIMHSHAVSAFDCVPYIVVSSADKQCGKTRLLEVMELLVAKPWLTGRCSPAVLARKINDVKPTLLLDESDAAFNGDKVYAETLRGVLNTGYLRGGKASLCVTKGKSIEYVDLETYCPKAIAGIGNVPDTIADRSIPIRLTRKMVGDKIERFRRRHVTPEAADIRAEIERWARTFVGVDHGEPAGLDAVGDRAADIIEPLLQIAEASGPDLAAEAREALFALCGGNRDDNLSQGARLLSDIRDIFGEMDEERITSSMLAAKLAAIETAPWEGAHGKNFGARDLARLLRPFGVFPGLLWFTDAPARGYERKHFEDAWSRFLPSVGTVMSVRSLEDHTPQDFFPNGSGPPNGHGTVRPDQSESATDTRPNGHTSVRADELLCEIADKQRLPNDLTDLTVPERGKDEMASGDHPYTCTEQDNLTCHVCGKAWACHGKPPRPSWRILDAGAIA